MNKEDVVCLFHTREKSEPYGHISFEDVYLSMSYYARQESLAFAEWLRTEYKIDSSAGGTYGYEDKLDKLYEEYLKSKLTGTINHIQ